MTEVARSRWISHVDEFIAGLVAQVTDRSIDPSFAVEPDGGRLRERSYNVYGHQNHRLYLFQHTLGLVNGEWQLRPIFRDDASGKQADCLCRQHRTLQYTSIDFLKSNMPARYQNFSLAFFWRNVWVKFRFLLHSEYLSMGIYLDLSGSDRLDNPDPLTLEGTNDPDLTLQTRIGDTFRAISEVCGKRHEDIIHAGTVEHRSESDRRLLAPLHQYLYETIWEDFEREIIGPSLNLCSAAPIEWKQIGSVVYDGRILLLHTPGGDQRSTTGHSQHLYADFLTAPHFDYVKLGSLADRIALDDTMDQHAAVTCADTMQPFISAPSRRIDSRTEYTANLLLGCRVMYMTSLSAEYTGSEGDYSPTKALLVCTLNHSWQLGRLIDRLFVMGSTRVAALINLEGLISAGQKLQSMTARLEQEDGLNREWTPEQLQEMENAAIKLRREAVDLSRDCDGGIEYRIERSRYYVRQFEEVEKTLRLDMVEGYQKYSFFVRRRYFSTFDHIDRLGIRLSRFRRALAALTQRISYRNDRLLQQRLLSLQVIAELFLIIPLIYYSGHILTECLNMLRSLWALADPWDHWIWLVPLVLLPSTIVVRVLGHREELRKLRAKVD